MITRKLDQRKRATPFIQACAKEISRMSAQRTADASPLGTMTRAMAGQPRQFRSTDTRNGVVVVWGGSDLPQYRAKAERILGVPVRVIHADMLGTVYAPKES